jgi:hypothetical protein
VLYKYHVGDVLMWAGKRPPMALPVVPGPAEPSATPPLAAPAGRPTPPAKPAGPGSLPTAVLLAPSKLQSHVALFVVDSLETAALERFCDFLLNRVTVRHRDGRALSWHGGDALLIKTIVLRLLARSLITVPGVGKDWSPPFADPGKSKYLSCPRDTILGGVSEEYARLLRASVEEVVGGETIEPSTLQSEVAKVYETVNTEQMPLLRKSRQQRMEARDVAEVLCGLNWLCNEELERRKVACSLWEAINPESGVKIDSYY